MKQQFKMVLACLMAALMTMSLFACGETPNQSKEASQEGTAGESTAEENQMAEYDETNRNLTGEAVSLKTEMIPATKEECLQAVFASMWAYYDKGEQMQYDESSMTVEGYAFSYRNTAFEAPEFANRDDYHYNVCNTFVQGVYNDAFAMYDYVNPDGFIYFTKNYKDFTGAHVVYSVSDPSESDLKNEVIPKVKSLLQPGDFICSYGETGHVMLFLGDIYGDGKNYLAHSWGANVDAEGKERFETNGSICIQTDEELIYSESGRWYLGAAKRSSSHVVIVRLLDADFFPNAMTQVVASRLQYPRMTIEKYLSVPATKTVTKGEKLTLYVEVSNKGTEDYKGLRIAENLPEGTKLVSGEQSVTVDIKAGETYTFALELEVDAIAGQSITFPKGAVAEIPTKEITVQVGASNVSESLGAKISEVAKNMMKDGAKDGALEFVNRVYKEAIGVELNLPKTIQEYLDATLKAKASRNVDARMLVWKTADDGNATLFKMQVPKLFGGRYYEANKDISNRILTLREKDLEVGDIIIRLTGDSKTEVASKSDGIVYLYLGDNVVMEVSNTAHQNYLSESIDYMLQSNFYTVLRPSRVYQFK